MLSKPKQALKNNSSFTMEKEETVYMSMNCLLKHIVMTIVKTAYTGDKKCTTM